MKDRRGRLWNAVMDVYHGRVVKDVEDRYWFSSTLWEAYQTGALDKIFDLEKVPSMSAKTLEIIEDHQIAVQCDKLSPAEADARVAAKHRMQDPDSVRRIVNRYAKEQEFRVRDSKK